MPMEHARSRIGTNLMFCDNFEVCHSLKYLGSTMNFKNKIEFDGGGYNTNRQSLAADRQKEADFFMAKNQNLDYLKHWIYHQTKSASGGNVSDSFYFNISYIKLTNIHYVFSCSNILNLFIDLKENQNVNFLNKNLLFCI